jgi:hypothetical protein
MRGSYRCRHVHVCIHFQCMHCGYMHVYSRYDLNQALRVRVGVDGK